MTRDAVTGTKSTFDGKWTDLSVPGRHATVIEGRTARLSNGEVARLAIVGTNMLSLETSTGIYDGRLDDGCKIKWHNGDVWIRVSEPEGAKGECCEHAARKGRYMKGAVPTKASRPSQACVSSRARPVSEDPVQSRPMVTQVAPKDEVCQWFRVVFRPHVPARTAPRRDADHMTILAHNELVQIDRVQDGWARLHECEMERRGLFRCDEAWALIDGTAFGVGRLLKLVEGPPSVASGGRGVLSYSESKRPRPGAKPIPKDTDVMHVVHENDKAWEVLQARRRRSNAELSLQDVSAEVAVDMKLTRPELADITEVAAEANAEEAAQVVKLAEQAKGAEDMRIAAP